LNRWPSLIQAQRKKCEQEILGYYKQALSDGLKKGAQTPYTFFPTKVNIDFPMLIHCTFDLDSSPTTVSQQCHCLVCPLVRP
jgi:hypothetical protein